MNNQSGIIVQIPESLLLDFLEWIRERNLHLQERHGNSNVVPFRRSWRQYVGCDLPGDTEKL